MKKLIGVLLLGLSSQYANAGTIYTTYTGSQNGVTIRDSATLVQSFFFDPGFAVDNITAGAGNSMYLTSGNSIYQYSTAGALLNSLTFPDASIGYQGITMAASESNIYTAYTGSQNGVSIRDSATLAQSFFFDPGFAVDNITAGAGNSMYLTSSNSIYQYSTAGALLNSLTFPDTSIGYQGITMAASGSNIYTTYTGSQNGVSIRDSGTLAQSFFFDPGFSVDNLVAGNNNDMFLTSNDTIYHYTNAGVQLNSFTFPQINYQGIAYKKVSEPASLAILGLGLVGFAFSRKTRRT
ncbi:Putative uncharacterized protein [Moritella viscosa]|uniref:Ice-binding protein C-terminal domain-containing protein n=2 Tax=Moritella viscosa TaxID=80854 RepID=A0A090IBU6_9GAMM|nr:PEP-CTERM sorting domain-containing protein [Moritella viscosa]CED59341.1 putative exported protein containing PEP-CTERM motif [Moritella viscosa]SGY88545.1 Putative uncharacterized protein [Moritella viscosa]SHO00343.1 Putative uncharacterized protein [Moritella viscosa]SHO00488.1 Putative uncharacterized protein [Moritella viscosa]SHO03554.1 Putative uncharacterized protein [Moritella viscosa]